jgi:hypothetical protein
MRYFLTLLGARKSFNESKIAIAGHETPLAAVMVPFSGVSQLPVLLAVVRKCNSNKYGTPFETTFATTVPTGLCFDSCHT